MPSLSVETYSLGELQTNCYLVWCTETNKAIIIDPADSGDLLSQEIVEHGLQLEAILLTHAHFDHCLGLLELSLNFAVPVYLHPKDVFLLAKAYQSAEHWLKHPVDPIPAVTLPLQEKDIISFGQCNLTVLETPGHTPGSVCFLYQPPKTTQTDEQFTFSKNTILFSGDTLFKDTIGRTDFSYASKKELFNSLRKLRELPTDTLLFSGHGEVGYLRDHPLFAKNETKE